MLWKENVEDRAAASHVTILRLEVLDLPYRQLSRPVVDFVDKIAGEKADRMVAVFIPKLVEPHWYDYLLHSFVTARLRGQLFLNWRDRVVVVSAPWSIKD